jgi:hypothetical protein
MYTEPQEERTNRFTPFENCHNAQTFFSKITASWNEVLPYWTLVLSMVK